jgi:hypothetical protein
MTLFLKRYNSLERRLRSSCGQDVPGHVTEAEGTIRSTSMYSSPPSGVPIAFFFFVRVVSGQAYKTRQVWFAE